MKPGDLVSFLNWNNEKFRNYRYDPDCRKEKEFGIILEIGADFAGHNLTLLSSSGTILDLHETIHVVEVLQ